MKKALLVLVLLASPAAAQETYTLSAAATNVTELTAIVTASNGRLCERYALASTCTQAQACTAAVTAGTTVGGGAACTATQARAAGIRIYPISQPGREEFVMYAIAVPAFNAMKATIVSRTQEVQCQNWQTATQPQKDAVCTASGLSAGCLLCP